MGDIADMMLDGDLCEGCGEYIGPGDGYRRLCSACRTPDDIDAIAHPVNRVNCKHPGCKKWLKTQDAMEQHYRNKHQRLK